MAEGGQDRRGEGAERRSGFRRGEKRNIKKRKEKEDKT